MRIKIVNFRRKDYECPSQRISHEVGCAIRSRKKWEYFLAKPPYSIPGNHNHTVGKKSIRALEIFRVQKLILNATSWNESLASHDL